MLSGSEIEGNLFTFILFQFKGFVCFSYSDDSRCRKQYFYIHRRGFRVIFHRFSCDGVIPRLQCSEGRFFGGLVCHAELFGLKFPFYPTRCGFWYDFRCESKRCTFGNSNCRDLLVVLEEFYSIHTVAHLDSQRRLFVGSIGCGGGKVCRPLLADN